MYQNCIRVSKMAIIHKVKIDVSCFVRDMVSVFTVFLLWEAQKSAQKTSHLVLNPVEMCRIQCFNFNSSAGLGDQG